MMVATATSTTRQAPGYRRPRVSVCERVYAENGSKRIAAPLRAAGEGEALSLGERAVYQVAPEAFHGFIVHLLVLGFSYAHPRPRATRNGYGLPPLLMAAHMRIERLRQPGAVFAAAVARAFEVGPPGFEPGTNGL